MGCEIPGPRMASRGEIRLMAARLPTIHPTATAFSDNPFHAFTAVAKPGFSSTLRPLALFEECNATARSLGEVHRRIRVRQQAFDGLTICRVDSDTYAGSDRKGESTNFARRRHCIEQLVGKVAQARTTRKIGKQASELIPAQTADNVFRA